MSALLPILSLLAALPQSGEAHFSCTFDTEPAGLASLPAAEQEAWRKTDGATPFVVKFPWASPEAFEKGQLFATRGDSLAGYTVEPGNKGLLAGATGPTELNRLFWPESIRLTMESGTDHWLWITLHSFDPDSGLAAFNLERQNRPAEIKTVWRVTGSCEDMDKTKTVTEGVDE